MENIVQIELKSILAIGVPANWDRGDPNNRIDPQETKLYDKKTCIPHLNVKDFARLIGKVQ